MKQITYVALFILISGCIDEYNPKGIEEVRNLLVVEGTITNTGSVILLRRSVGLSETLTGSETVDHAYLYIEREDGERYSGYFAGNGSYHIPTGKLQPEQQYRLHISLDGEEYESTFLSPLFTPEIDSVYPMKRGPGAPVYMCVATHDPLNQSKYYIWSYKEHWEVTAELRANAGLDSTGRITFYDYSTSHNTYYCWGKDSSKTLILGSSEKLSENIIAQKRLIELPCNDDKLSVLHYIKVEQKQIRKEAYDYYTNLQKNIEQTGSIFAPVPSEMKGNISCITNPDLPVIGYIDVSTITEKELFIPEEKGLYEAPVKRCYLLIEDDANYFGYPIYGYYLYYENGATLWAPHRCVDCRMSTNASKTKPDFWPTDNL